MSEDDGKSETRKLETVENDDDDDNVMTGDDQELDDIEEDKEDEDEEDSNMDVDDDVETKHHHDFEEKEELEDDDSGDEDEDQDQEEKLTENYTSTIRIKNQRYHTPKIFQDAITVLIPLDVTADLKIAMKKTRAKRILSIYNKFPSLKKETKKLDDKNNLKDDDEPMLDDEEEENAKEKDDKQPPSKKKKMENVPHPDQFGSVLDYLEAKYVKGVMLEEDDEDGAPIGLDDKSEGQGSVYSRDSFLDDTDLQRDVAEQVMASTTLTKLELEHEDGDFFVNVGTLEVENDDYGDNYDPLQDKENTGKTKPKTTKKRKKSSSAASTTSAKSSKSSKSSKVTTSTAASPASKSKKIKTEQKKKKQQQQPPTSAAKSTNSIKSAVSTASTTKSKKTVEKKGDKVAKLAAKKAKSHSDALFKKAAGMIKKLTSEELPKRTTKRKVALKCPKNKKPGDDITFTNPHNPGQKLRVKVPKDCFPGGTFKVTVPVLASTLAAANTSSSSLQTTNTSMVQSRRRLMRTSSMAENTDSKEEEEQQQQKGVYYGPATTATVVEVEVEVDNIDGNDNDKNKKKKSNHNNEDNDHYLRPPRVGILNRKDSYTSGRTILNWKELAYQLSKISYVFYNNNNNHNNNNSNNNTNNHTNTTDDENSNERNSTVQVTFFEGKTFEEQIQFFRNTDILISPHGAQLTGLIFMSSSTSSSSSLSLLKSNSDYDGKQQQEQEQTRKNSCKHIMELFPKNYAIPYYFGSLAVQSGIRHSYVYYDDGITKINITETDGSKSNYHYGTDNTDNDPLDAYNKKLKRLHKQIRYSRNPSLKELMPWERIIPRDYIKRRNARTQVKFCPRQNDMNNMVIELIMDWYKCRRRRLMVVDNV